MVWIAEPVLVTSTAEETSAMAAGVGGNFKITYSSFKVLDWHNKPMTAN